MLAHNEAANIAAAIAGVRWAEQIVVVDAESDDGTGDLARQLGATVVTQPNRTNLNVNKNIAISHCRSEWVLVLDADERISDDLAGEIRRVIADGDADGFLIPRRNFVLGRWLRHGSQYPDWQLRLFRRRRGRFEERHVHERLRVEGRVVRLREPMDHHPYTTVSSLIRKGEFYAAFEAGKLQERGVRIGAAGLVWNGLVRPIARLARRLIFKGGILDGAPGLMMAAFDAWSQTLRWMMLWQTQHSERMKDEG